jgi:hypothetical protein
MQEVIRELQKTIEQYNFLLLRINEEAFSKRPAPGKWSKKEELGHLIDSAQNNIQRFIRVQYEHVHITYNPDYWVDCNDYQTADMKGMIQLWHLLNLQIIHILQKMDPSVYERTIDIGYEMPNQKTTLFIAQDYILHMKHHLESIFA